MAEVKVFWPAFCQFHPGLICHYLLEGTVRDYIEKCLRTESPPDDNLKARLLVRVREVHAVFGLQTEVGELVDRFKREIFYGKEPDRTNVKEEIGDVLWYISLLLDCFGLTYEEVMEANIAKLAKRYPDKFNSKDAVNRNLSAERWVLEKKGSGTYYIPDESEYVPPLEKPRPEFSGYDTLKRFKHYVHDRLDQMGVPDFKTDPEVLQNGCRIGKRLDYVEQRLQGPNADVPSNPNQESMS